MTLCHVLRMITYWHVSGAADSDDDPSHQVSCLFLYLTCLFKVIVVFLFNLCDNIERSVRCRVSHGRAHGAMPVLD